MKNAPAIEPERSPGLSEAPEKYSEAEVLKKKKNIEGIGHLLLNTANPNLLPKLEICRIWIMKCINQENY